MAYTVIINPSAEKSLDRLPSAARIRIVDAMESLQDDPRLTDCVALVGEQNAWGIRVGDYRIVYEIHDRQLVVLVVGIGHRQDIYRKSK